MTNIKFDLISCDRCGHSASKHHHDGIHKCFEDRCTCNYFVVPRGVNSLETKLGENQMTDGAASVNIYNIDLPSNLSLEDNYRRIATDLGMDPELIESSLRDLGKNIQKSADDVNVEATRPDVPIDAINPSHYRDGKIEVWDFIVDKKLDYCLGAAVKYISRAGKKGGAEKELEDLKKAQNYIGRKIREIEERDS